jgi:hypothetical protein
MFNFNRLVIATGIVSAVSLVGVSNKAVAQISTTTNPNDTATFTATATVATLCQFDPGTWAQITNLAVTNQLLGQLETTGGNVSFSCNSSGGTINAVINMTGNGHTATNVNPTKTFSLTPATPGSISGSGTSYTINSPITGEQVDIALDLDYGTQLLAGNYTATVVLTIAP